MTPLRLLTIVVLATTFLGTIATHGAEAAPLNLWPATPPGDESFRAPPSSSAPASNDGIQRITLVERPTLSIFRPAPERANGAAILVCPGGGFNILAWDLEGTEIADWLTGRGYTVGVLKYRVPRRSASAPQVAPVQDGVRALRLMRAHAAEWAVDPHRVGILGFSAGGALAILAATPAAETAYAKLDASDSLPGRPDFVIGVYPAYLGDEEKAGPLRSELQGMRDYPPTFLVVTDDDMLRGFNAALFYAELKKANRKAELHIFGSGGHGYGLRPSPNPVSGWPRLCEQWLASLGLDHR